MYMINIQLVLDKNVLYCSLNLGGVCRRAEGAINHPSAACGPEPYKQLKEESLKEEASTL